MENEQPHWARTILYSLAWLICCLFVIVDALAVREATLDVLISIQAQKVQAAPQGQANEVMAEFGNLINAIDQGMLFFGGVVAITLAIAIEVYFRTGQKQGLLVGRIGRVVAILIAVFVACVIIQTLV